MIFSVSEPPQYIVALFTGGKTPDMEFVFRNKSKTIRISGLIGIFKKQYNMKTACPEWDKDCKLQE
jgi:hypothetical protein